MTDRLATGLARLHARRKECMGRTVTYTRGEDSVELTATVGETAFRLTDGYAAEVVVRMRDYLITAADLVLDDAQVEPQAGDRIVEGSAVYEVMGPGNGEPEWRWSGPDGTTLRIHTKHVDTES